MRHLIKCFVFVCLLALTACGGGKTKGNRVVTVTIEPQRYFAEKIAGDKFDIHCIVPAGQSPETYDPTPGQMVEIGQSLAYLRIGYIGFEQVWMKSIQDNNPDLEIVDLSSGFELITNELHEHEHHEGHHHHGVDPHIWSSISGAQVIARNMVEAFVRLDPENRDYYQANYEMLAKEITATGEAVASLLQPIRGRVFIIYHPALTYFAKEFGFKQLCIEMEGKEPSPAELKRLVETARREECKVVFVQQEFDRKNAELIAEETGCLLEPINPLAYDWHHEMIHIAKTLADGQTD